MDKYAEVCWRNKPDEINDALDAYRSRVLALEAREKELGEGKLEWQRKYHDCLSKNDSYNSEFMELRQENYRLRKVVDAARGFRKLGYAESDALDKALRELDGDKYKCRHLISDQVGVTCVCRSCGEMC